jgi:hypothetical protein
MTGRWRPLAELLSGSSIGWSALRLLAAMVSQQPLNGSKL